MEGKFARTKPHSNLDNAKNANKGSLKTFGVKLDKDFIDQIKIDAAIKRMKLQDYVLEALTEYKNK